jgi:hypothetical protein
VSPLKLSTSMMRWSLELEADQSSRKDTFALGRFTCNAHDSCICTCVRGARHEVRYLSHLRRWILITSTRTYLPFLSPRQRRLLHIPPGCVDYSCILAVSSKMHIFGPGPGLFCIDAASLSRTNLASVPALLCLRTVQSILTAYREIRTGASRKSRSLLFIVHFHRSITACHGMHSWCCINLSRCRVR